VKKTLKRYKDLKTIDLRVRFGFLDRQFSDISKSIRKINHLTLSLSGYSIYYFLFIIGCSFRVSLSKETLEFRCCKN